MKKMQGKKGGIVEQRGLNPVTVGVMGAVAGAAMGTAAGMVLSSENNRKKFGEVVKTLTKNAPGMIDQASQKMQELRGRAVGMIDTAQKQLDSPKTVQKVARKSRTKKAL